MALENVNVGDPHASAHNAERQAINQLENTVGGHTTDINQLELDLGLVDAKPRYVRGVLIANANVNDYHGSEYAGAWHHSGFSIAGTPPSGWSNGTLLVIAASGAFSTQIATQGSGQRQGATWVRSRSTTLWSDWKRIDIDEGAIRFDSRQTGITEAQQYDAKLNAGINHQGFFVGDLNTLFGHLKAASYVISATGSSNLPVVGQAGVLLVEASAANVDITRQTYSLRDGRTYNRVYNDSTSVWTDWRRIDIDTGAVRFDAPQSLTTAQKDVVAGNLMGSLSMARGYLRSDDDMDDLWGESNAGSWGFGTPANAPGGGGVVVVGASAGEGNSWTVQHATLRNGGTFSRSQTVTDSTSPRNWTPWVRLDNEAHEMRGTGSPLGVVAAPPGTYYTDTAGTLGAWRWLKTSGTGTTGWTVIHGDTGWRNVSDLLDPTSFSVAATAGACRIRRVNERVLYQTRLSPLEAIVGSNRSASYRITDPLPIGFRPGAYHSWGHVMLVNSIVGAAHNLNGLHRLNVTLYQASGAWAASDVISFNAEWTDDGAWPTSLPGTPA